ncbi:hypothetical protein chiPu_0025008, partial [Chiloscyllium punctatum]|nr:hypothetical protein [Chiloscyllium punctatum]
MVPALWEAIRHTGSVPTLRIGESPNAILLLTPCDPVSQNPKAWNVETAARELLVSNVDIVTP